MDDEYKCGHTVVLRLVTLSLSLHKLKSPQALTWTYPSGRSVVKVQDKKRVLRY